MKTINDGGPAFPCDWKDFQPETREQFGGMSLRDWFAGQALTGMLAMCAGESVNGGTSSETAKYAYDHADAMISERNKP